MNQGWVTKLLLLLLWLFRQWLIFSIKHGLHSSHYYSFFRIHHPLFTKTQKSSPSSFSMAKRQSLSQPWGGEQNPDAPLLYGSRLLSPSCCTFCWQAMHFFLASKTRSHIFFILYFKTSKGKNATVEQEANSWFLKRLLVRSERHPHLLSLCAAVFLPAFQARSTQSTALPPDYALDPGKEQLTRKMFHIFEIKR